MDIDELSAVDYARHFRLTSNYAFDHPFACKSNLVHEGPARRPAPDPPLCNYASALKSLLVEKLTISEQGKELVMRCVSSTSATGWDVPEAPRQQKEMSLKLDLPLLFTDNEYEFSRFCGSREPVSSDKALARIETGDTDSNALATSQIRLRFSTLLNNHVQAEKLQISESAIRLLESSLPSDCPTPQTTCSIARSPIHTKVCRLGQKGARLMTMEYRRLRSLTPPLLPLTPLPAMMSAAELFRHVSPLTSPCDVDQDRARQLDIDLMASDAIYANMLKHQDDSRTDNSYSSGTPEIRSRTLRAPALRVEGPLTPPLIPSSPFKRIKTAAFIDTPHEYVAEMPSTFISTEDMFTSSNDISAMINEELMWSQNAAKHALTETLLRADSTLRVHVPKLPTMEPSAPWILMDPHQLANRRITRTDQVKAPVAKPQGIFEGSETLQRWHGQKQLEQTLIWTPFLTSLGNIDLNEDMQINFEVHEGIELQLLHAVALSETITSVDLVKQKYGLKLSDNNDYVDDELDVGEFQGYEELLILPQNEDTKQSGKRVALNDTDSLALGRARKPLTEDRPRRPSEGSTHKNIVQLRTRAASIGSETFHALGNFMLTRGSTVAQATDLCNAFESRKTAGIRSSEAVASEMFQQKLIRCTTPAELSSIGRDPLSAHSLSTQASGVILVARELFRFRRTLIRHISYLCPETILIERDLRSTQVPNRRPPGRESVRNSASTPSASTPLVDEGDLIISPSISIILTSIQKIKQRPLPGTVSQNNVNQRIALVQLRFEHVIVVVSGAIVTAQEVTFEDERDKSALADLEAATMRLESKVSVQCMAGNDHDLAVWLVGTFRQNAVSEALVRRIAKEDWQFDHEVVLRKLGINTFAAIAILHSLYVNESEPASVANPAMPNISNQASLQCKVQGADAKLASGEFMTMTPQQRIDKYASMFGGTVVLERINAAIQTIYASLPS